MRSASPLASTKRPSLSAHCICVPKSTTAERASVVVAVWDQLVAMVLKCSVSIGWVDQAGKRGVNRYEAPIATEWLAPYLIGEVLHEFDLHNAQFMPAHVFSHIHAPMPVRRFVGEAVVGKRFAPPHHVGQGRIRHRVQ